MYNILDEYPTTFQALKSPQPVHKTDSQKTHNYYGHVSTPID
ncbi:hypothetical protein OOU_Y34scaffold00056g1 [Pyricularia oryzae Y34]|uniref:Uncharacterized protein n=2 Tax=Pyricularia oryzae TaxID=318829 RepID=A0AA97P9X0_PYRO3|nr:hypothetical protein OOU_Y34scaffold00056g1 [Pyricularia oryzae Y34]